MGMGGGGAGPAASFEDSEVERFLAHEHTPATFTREVADRIRPDQVYVDVYDDQPQAAKESDLLELSADQRREFESNLLNVRRLVNKRNTVLDPSSSSTNDGPPVEGTERKPNTASEQNFIATQAQYNVAMLSRLKQWVRWDQALLEDALHLFTRSDRERTVQRADLLRSTDYVDLETRLTTLDVALRTPRRSALAAAAASSSSSSREEDAVANLYDIIACTLGDGFTPFLYKSERIQPSVEQIQSAPPRTQFLLFVSASCDVFVCFVLDSGNAYVTHFYIPPLRHDDPALKQAGVGKASTSQK